MKNYILFNILRSLLFGIVYAIFEVNVPFYKYIPDLDYRILYFAIFGVAMISLNFAVWFANFMLSMMFEDISYWLIKEQLPFSYAWYYPVVDHVPVVDVIEGVLAVVFYSIAYSKSSIYTYTPGVKHYVESCNMFYYFTHGKTHDLYGLLVLIVVGVLSNIYAVNMEEKLASLVSIIVGVGVFVDLWAHCFSH